MFQTCSMLSNTSCTPARCPRVPMPKCVGYATPCCRLWKQPARSTCGLPSRAPHATPSRCTAKVSLGRCPLRCQATTVVQLNFESGERVWERYKRMRYIGWGWQVGLTATSPNMPHFLLNHFNLLGSHGRIRRKFVFNLFLVFLQKLQIKIW
jgi:hypothetical protein